MVELPYLLRSASYFGLFLAFLGCERLAPFAKSEQSKSRRHDFRCGNEEVLPGRFIKC